VLPEFSVTHCIARRFMCFGIKKGNQRKKMGRKQGSPEKIQKGAH
jgi:hypothetical protein